MMRMKISTLLACVVLIYGDSVAPDDDESSFLRILTLPKIEGPINIRTGTKLQLFCNFSTIGQMSWKKNDEVIENSNPDVVSGIVHTIESASVSDTAKYTCEGVENRIPHRQSITVTVTEPPEIPENNNEDLPRVTINDAKAVGAHSIYLSWTLQDDNAQVTKIIIEHEKDSTSEKTSVTLDDPTISSYVLNELESKTPYRIKISTYNAIGDSQSTYLKDDKRITTLEEGTETVFVPTIKVTEKNDTSITLAFSGKPEDLKDQPFYYNVTVTRGNNETDSKYLPEVDAEEVTLDLTPRTVDKYRAAACNNYTRICGNWSNEVTSNSPGLRATGINFIAVITASIYFTITCMFQ